MLSEWGPGASVIRAAVHMELEGMGMRTGHRAHTNGVRVRNEHRDVGDDCGAIKEALACNKIEIE